MDFILPIFLLCCKASHWTNANAEAEEISCGAHAVISFS